MIARDEKADCDVAESARTRALFMRSVWGMREDWPCHARTCSDILQYCLNDKCPSGEKDYILQGVRNHVQSSHFSIDARNWKEILHLLLLGVHNFAEQISRGSGR
eukprot:TRINITY_DN15403_c0_g1_i1.p1 TRINITY_DN15403_c0_g1~~TRINITY_DN15403_c0_g1_i1.p1  ORF type:complete len:113 (+),score=14.48 TRINITY_DN15403_c0_g1_i1:25-339(+)